MRGQSPDRVLIERDVVVEQHHERVPGFRHAAIARRAEPEVRVVDDDAHGHMRSSLTIQPVDGIIRAPVVDDDDLDGALAGLLVCRG